MRHQNIMARAESLNTIGRIGLKQKRQWMRRVVVWKKFSPQKCDSRAKFFGEIERKWLKCHAP